MQRKESLKLLALLGGSMILSNAVSIKACAIWNKREAEDEIIIIGAGAAGLHAAYLLRQQGCKVKILEANDRIGGRIHALENFSEIPIELGAEFVNGKNILRKIAQQSGVQLKIQQIEEHICLFLNDKILSYSEIPEKDIQDFLKSIDKIAAYKGSDQTLDAFLATRSIPQLLQPLYKSIGIESGASNKQISTKALAQIFQKTKFEAETENIYRPIGRYIDVFKQHYALLKKDIMFKTIVKKIDYSNEKIKVYDQDNNEFQADKVIITAPLPVLKNGLSFYPTLPMEKQNAIAALEMGPGMKVILKFHERFWRKDMSMLEGSSCATYWTHGESTILTAFCVGEHAEKVSVDPVNLLLQDLSSLFKMPLSDLSLVDAHIMDWTKEQFIGGYCCYPNTASFFENKATLAKSVADKLFFAGEATNTNPQTLNYVHGAIETAEKVVKDLLLIA